MAQSQAQVKVRLDAEKARKELIRLIKKNEMEKFWRDYKDQNNHGYPANNRFWNNGLEGFVEELQGGNVSLDNSSNLPFDVVKQIVEDEEKARVKREEENKDKYMGLFGSVTPSANSFADTLFTVFKQFFNSSDDNILTYKEVEVVEKDCPFAELIRTNVSKLYDSEVRERISAKSKAAIAEYNKSDKTDGDKKKLNNSIQEITANLTDKLLAQGSVVPAVRLVEEVTSKDNILNAIYNAADGESEKQALIDGLNLEIIANIGDAPADANKIGIVQADKNNLDNFVDMILYDKQIAENYKNAGLGIHAKLSSKLFDKYTTLKAGFEELSNNNGTDVHALVDSLKVTANDYIVSSNEIFNTYGTKHNERKDSLKTEVVDMLRDLEQVKLPKIQAFEADLTAKLTSKVAERDALQVSVGEKAAREAELKRKNGEIKGLKGSLSIKKCDLDGWQYEFDNADEGDAITKGAAQRHIRQLKAEINRIENNIEHNERLLNILAESGNKELDEANAIELKQVEDEINNFQTTIDGVTAKRRNIQDKVDAIRGQNADATIDGNVDAQYSNNISTMMKDIRANYIAACFEAKKMEKLEEEYNAPQVGSKPKQR